MKLSISIIFFGLLPCAALFGQSSKYEFGVQLQAGMSDMIYQNQTVPPSIEKFINESAGARFSPGIAVFGQYHFNPKFLLQIGLGYEWSGYRAKEFDLYQSTPDNPEGQYLGKAKGLIHYHDLNLSFHAKFKPLESIPGLYCFGGVANLFNIGRRQTTLVKFDTGEVLRTTADIPQDFKKFTRWNLRSDLGFGYTFKAFGTCRFFVEPKFGYTIFPVLTEFGGKYRQYVAGLNVGYIW